MSNPESCIVRHFSHYCDLTEHDMDILLELEKSPLNVFANDVLWEEGAKADNICTVKEGWAYSYRSMNDGTRQVMDIYLPGDVIGMREFAFQERLTGVAMLTDGIVCRFPNKSMIDIFTNSPQLTAVFFAISARQQALLTERLVNLGRRNAREKVAHFVYEMYVRLRRTNPDIGNYFSLPLSQQIFADILGLSAVHISRTFSELREEGLIFRDRNRVEIPDLARLAEVSGFSDKYLNDHLNDYFT
ncbi:Crp/Fnr family transcriptional regulator [Phytohalomonas tamaricis]|uniref:Crp/Fnr family transcriptional regulator n=1 Tax=Phytohalomonas tamaricis TaxID=2081032 RepID=UPI000D0BE58A|nr:Crp/Fnr family transcriptional regulator [Phytohalomonas tamaricis]